MDFNNLSLLCLLLLFTFSCKNDCNEELHTKSNLIDVGNVSEEKNAVAELVIYNYSMREAIIDTIVPDCSCFKIRYPSKIINKNDSLKILIKHDKSIPGNFQNTFDIYFVCNAKLRFKIRGNILL